MQGEVVRLGAARREDHVTRLHPEARRDRLARVLDERLSAPASRMHASRIGPAVAPRFAHRAFHVGMRRGRGVPIEVDLLGPRTSTLMAGEAPTSERTAGARFR